MSRDDEVSALSIDGTDGLARTANRTNSPDSGGAIAGPSRGGQSAEYAPDPQSALLLTDKEWALLDEICCGWIDEYLPRRYGPTIQAKRDLAERIVAAARGEQPVHIGRIES